MRKEWAAEKSRVSGEALSACCSKPLCAGAAPVATRPGTGTAGSSHRLCRVLFRGASGARNRKGPAICRPAPRVELRLGEAGQPVECSPPSLTLVSAVLFGTSPSSSGDLSAICPRSQGRAVKTVKGSRESSNDGTARCQAGRRPERPRRGGSGIVVRNLVGARGIVSADRIMLRSAVRFRPSPPTFRLPAVKTACGRRQKLPAGHRSSERRSSCRRIPRAPQPAARSP